MRLEVAPYQFAASSTDSTALDTVGGGDTKLSSSKVSRNSIASSSSSTSTSSLNIKVPDGNKKTTPPKPSPKRSMRRRRSGDDYYHPNDGDGIDGTDKSKGASTGVDGSRSSTAGTSIKDSRYARPSSSRRVKRESTSENTESHKTGTGRSKGSSSSTKTLTDSLRTEDIPVGQWIVLISLLVGIFGYVRQCNKNSTKNSEKQLVTTKKKKDKKKTNIQRNHSSMNGRRKGKSHHSSNGHKSKTAMKQNIIKTKTADKSNQDEIAKPTETEHQKPDEEPPVIENTTTEITESNPPSEPQPTRKKKKRVRKKSAKIQSTNIPVVSEDVLIPSSKSSPDSVSTDGSSTTANISHQDRDHSVNEEEFNQSFSNDYEDYADFEVQTPEAEWTTVPTRAPKIQSSNDSEKDGEVVVVTNAPEVTVESSSSSVSKDVLQPQDKVEISNTDEGSTISDVVKDADTTLTSATTEDTITSKPESEVSTETSYESDVTPQTNNHTPNKAECSNESNSIDNDQNSVEVEQEEELSDINTSLHDEDKNEHKDDDTKEVDTSSFSQDGDEALARMLQKEEEDMAAAADIKYELSAVVSPKGRPEVGDVWEQVKKKRTKKQQATTTTTTVIMEEQ